MIKPSVSDGNTQSVSAACYSKTLDRRLGLQEIVTWSG